MPELSSTAAKQLAALITARALTGDAGTVAALLNVPEPVSTQPRAVIPAWEIVEAIVPAEWANLTAQEKQRIQTIISAGSVNIRGTNTRAAFQAAFPAGSATRANLLALQTESVLQAPCRQALGMDCEGWMVAQARGEK